MKRVVISGYLVITLITGLIPTSHASVTPGAKCSKAGDERISGGLIFTCKKSRSKLVWSQGEKAPEYDKAFASALLLEAQARASQILADAKTKAKQISSPPNCTTSNSIASVSLGSDGNLLSLIFSNPGICDLTVRATAAFLCPDGRVQKISNYVISTGIFPLRAGEKLFVNINVSYYFPQVINECRLLTGYSSNLVNISSYHQPPNVVTLASTFTGNFSQSEATKRANQFLASEKARADQIVSDARKPEFIARAWKAAADAKVAAEKAAADAKVAAEKAAADAKAAALAECAQNGRSCEIGNSGPGGGIVFYDAGSQQPWGRYLEFAPRGWSGSAQDPITSWCNIDVVLLTQVSIGSGKANTDSMVARCTSGAAVMARAYKGNGKVDWSLPSKDELNELCKYLRGQATGNSKISCNSNGDERRILQEGFFENYYRSSSETSAKEAWIQTFSNGYQGNLAPKDAYSYFVRPIRAF